MASSLRRMGVRVECDLALLRERSARGSLLILRGGDERLERPAGVVRLRGARARVDVDVSPVARIEGGEKIVADRRRNGEVYLCAWPRPERIGERSARELTSPTRDPNDRAHELRDQDDGGKLHPSRGMGGQSQARRYPPCQLNNAGFAVDSQFDELYERQRRLDREVGGVAGVSLGGGAGKSATGVALARLEVVCGRDDGAFERVRSVLRRRTWEGER